MRTPTAAEDFSLAAIVRAQLAQTWSKVGSHERDVHERLVDQHGPCARANSVRLPHHALALRDMTATGSSGSQYLVGTTDAGYLPALQPRSVVLSLGAQTFNAGAGHIVLTKGTGATVTQWLADENTAITESQPTFGQVASSPKILAALTEVSHQALLQSNAEQVLRLELNRAAAAALDKAALQGTGTLGQPTGIVNTAGIGTFTGATLNRSALTNAQLDVAGADAVLGSGTGYVTTPTVANLLANRADTVSSATPVWQGNLHDGVVIGERALSTTGMPASSMLYGAWEGQTIVSWGTLEIAVDPFTKFNYGIVAVRLLMIIDTVVTQPAAFSYASSVS